MAIKIKKENLEVANYRLIVVIRFIGRTELEFTSLLDHFYYLLN